MKILGPSSVQRVDTPQRVEGRAGRPTDTDYDAVQAVVLSDTASFVRSLRETAAGTSVVRMGEVARAREDIVSGAIDTEAEFAGAVDGFLASI